MGDLLILAIWEINTQKNMNFGYPNDPVMKYLIRAAIYTSRLYVWLRNYKLRIFSLGFGGKFIDSEFFEI